MADNPRVPFEARPEPRAPHPGQEPSSRDNGDPPDRTETQPPDVRPAKQDPAYIGPYRTLLRVGEGGMGIVYKCEQREPVRRIVAAKVIKVGMDTREVVARFDAERQALSMMNHPNVARALDAGVTDSGRPYFAMEYVPGVAITRYCDDHRLTIRERLELFIPVCHAVQHAHQKGVIHRDLKPSNILVTQIDGQPVPKVIDFGIAKAANYALTQQTLCTQVGAMIGTPEYMSPEQARTTGIDVDTRADVYSLGVVLYELLTGALPFDPDVLRCQGPDGIARMIRESEPRRPSTKLAMGVKEAAEAGAPPAAAPAPSAKPPVTAAAERRGTDPRTLIRELRGDLDWIVMKALEKDRARRYETANGLLVDIRRHLEQEPVFARPPTAMYRLSKLIRRNRAAFAAILAVVASLVLGITGAGVAMVAARAAERNANLEAQNARTAEYKANQERENALAAEAKAMREAKKAQAVNTFLLNVLAPPERAGDERLRDAKVVDLLARAAEDVGTQFRDQPDVEFQTRYALFRTYSNLGLAELAKAQIDGAWEMVRKARAVDTDTGLRVAADYARVYRGDRAERERLARDFAARASKLLGEQSEPAIIANTVLAETMAGRGATNDADRLTERLIAQLRAKGVKGVEDANATMAFAYLGGRLNEDKRYDEAERILQYGMDQADISRYNRVRMRWIFSTRLATALEGQGRGGDAADRLKEVIVYLRGAMGGDHPSISPTVQLYVDLLRRLGRNDDIKAVEEQERQIFAEAANQIANTPILLARRAHARVCVGRFNDAVDDYAKLVETDPDEHKHWYYQACLLAYLGRRDEYDRHVDLMLTHFGLTTDRVACVRLAKAAMLLPPARDEHRRRVAQMLDHCAGDGKDEWHRLAKALADYRNGQFDDAIRNCGLIEQSPLNNVAGDASVPLLCALARHAGGDTDQARSDLQKARHFVADHHLPSLDSGRISAVGIEDWLVYQVLLHEVNSTFPAQ